MMPDAEDEVGLCRLADTAFYFLERSCDIGCIDDSNAASDFLTGGAGEGEGDYDLV